MKINKFLQNEIDKKIPNVSNDIKMNLEMSNTHKKIIFSKKKIAFSICICLFICCLFIPLFFIDNNKADNYFLTIDVNPVIRLTYNKNNRVINQQGLNEDGVIFLYKENYIGQNILDVSKKIVNKLNSKNLILNGFKIDIKDDHGADLKNEEDDIIKYIKKSFNNSFDITNISEDDFDRIEDYYEENEIIEYESVIRDKIFNLANNKLIDINNLITTLKGYDLTNDDNEDSIVLNFKHRDLLENFTKKYHININFNIGSPTYGNLVDLVDDLCEDKIEIEKSLNKINNAELDLDKDELIDELFDLFEDMLFDD